MKTLTLSVISALFLAILLPGMAMADDVSSAKTTASTQKSSAGSDPVRFNWVDGEPIHVILPPGSSPQ